MKIKADKILINGKIYTVNKNRDWAEAICVTDERISYVGKTAEAMEYWGEETEIIDLSGKLLLPGFIEAHAHPLMAALWKSGLILNIDMSIDEVLNSVSRYVKEYPEKDVYFGQGFSAWMFGEDGPNKKLLDEIICDKPILLLDAGGHAGWCNTKALEIACVTADTPDPLPGSQFFRRDEDGNPTGSLVEWGAVSVICDAIGAIDKGAVQKTIGVISDDYSAAGVTAIQDGGSFREYQDMVRRIGSKASQEGQLKQRIIASEGVFTAEDLPGAVERLKEAREIYTGDKFAVTHLKIIEDGTFEARSAATKLPFEDGSLIPPFFTEEQLVKIVEEAAAIHSDICIHGIGDKAIYNILLAAQNIREKGYDDTRIACIHCNYIDEEDINKFAKYDVIANTTCVWHHQNKGKEEVIGDRALRNFLMNTLYKQGVKLTFGSDFPADEYGKEPLKGIEMGITRQMFGYPEEPILPPLSERLTVAKMIEGYTINGAYMMRMEDKIGSVETGKYADLVVLDENLFEIDPHDIHNVNVIMTMINGEIVYRNR